MDTLSILIQTLITGISMGGVYLLIGIGLTLIFGVIKVVNFAHGSFMTVAMYTTLWLFNRFELDPYLSILINIPIIFMLGYVVQRLLINPILEAPHLNQLLLTLGLLLIIENTLLYFKGADPLTMRLGYSIQSLRAGGLILSIPRLITLGVALLYAGLLYLFLARTETGRAIRATASDRQAASSVGINVKLMYALAFGIGSTCVGVAGAIIMIFFYVHPYVGHTFLLLAFVIVIIGGLGSIFGAFVSGLLIGMIDTFGATFLPGTSGRMLIFATLIVVLLFRPAGLFKR
ncbi:MAG: branched-chain amino acid ABC transporter permease [Thermodesulfobacteriota bacterium]